MRPPSGKRTTRLTIVQGHLSDSGHRLCRWSAPARGRDGESARSGEGGDRGDRRPAARCVGAEAGGKGADDEAGVAPEAVDADRLGPLAWFDGVRDGGDQRRVDERRAETQEDGGDERGAEAATARDEESERTGLDEHAEHDQWLSAGVVGEPAGSELS